MTDKIDVEIIIKATLFCIEYHKKHHYMPINKNHYRKEIKINVVWPPLM